MGVLALIEFSFTRTFVIRWIIYHLKVINSKFAFCVCFSDVVTKIKELNNLTGWF